MKPYCLKCKKDTENINLKEFQKQVIIAQWYDQNVQNVEVENQDSLKVKKQKSH